MLRVRYIAIVLFTSAAIALAGNGNGNNGNGNGNGGPNGNGNGNGNNGNGNGNNGNGNGNGNGKNNSPKNKKGGARQSRSANGPYQLTVAGSFSGTGNATVTDTTVSLIATISDGQGHSGQLVVSNMLIDGPYFTGTGTVMGKPMTVHGRLDAAQASRFACTYCTDDGYSGRAAGALPAATDPPDTTWQDN